MKRSQARETVFLLLFEFIFNHDSTADEILQRAIQSRNLEVDAYINYTFPAILEKIDELDKIINEYSIKWKADRLTKPALCAARLAIFEILYLDDVPVPIAINEAIELIKKYDSNESAKYVNGFLGSWAKKHG